MVLLLVLYGSSVGMYACQLCFNSHFRIGKEIEMEDNRGPMKLTVYMLLSVGIVIFGCLAMWEPFFWVLLALCLIGLVVAMFK